MRRLWAGIALGAVSISASLTAVGAAKPPPTTAQILRGLAPAVDPVIADLVESGDGGPPPALPADPLAALAGGVARIGAQVGFALDALGSCMDASDTLVSHLPVPVWTLFDDRVAARTSLPGSDVEAIRLCALRLERGGLELKRFLASAPRDQGGSIDVWPVLRFNNAGANDVVLNDYLLSVDRGGHTQYYNNAGGNLIDVRRGPPGSPAPINGPARGCVNPVYDLHEGQCIIVYANHFLPATVTVERGGTLQFFDPDPWGNGEAPGHTVTERHFPGPRFDSGVVGLGKAGDVSGVSALAPGSYPFTCHIHPFMHGLLIVR